MINNQPIRSALDFHDLRYGKSPTNQNTRDQQRKIHFTKISRTLPSSPNLHLESYLLYQTYISNPTFFTKPTSRTLPSSSNLHLKSYLFHQTYIFRTLTPCLDVYYLSTPTELIKKSEKRHLTSTTRKIILQK
jgi:hypothetical protein